MAKKFLVILAGICFFLTTGIALAGPSEKEMMVKLGDKLMFDKQLSTPPGQSCADCHTPRTGWTGPIPGINKKGAVYPGAIHQRTGNRRPPTAAYASTAPLFGINEEGIYEGGNFWDGRATGLTLGNPAADQAMFPFLNPVEQNNPDEETVVYKVCNSTYSNLFKKVAKSFYNDDSLDICTSENTMIAYNLIAGALAVFEDSSTVNQFSSKFDAFWEKTKGDYDLNRDSDPTGIFTQQEWEGFQLFVADNNNNGIYEEGEGGMCAACHPVTQATANTAYSQVKSRVDDSVSLEEINLPPLFTDYSYDNLGTPKNPENPFYEMDEVYVNGEPINPEGDSWIDPGLAGFLYKDQLEEENFDITETPEYGLHKVPTLRNVDKRPGRGFAKAYMHNGVFKSLKEVVHFYNTRDEENANWPDAEVAANVNKDELGKLGLSDAQEDAIVAFMQTLSDGYKAKGKGKKNR